MPPPTGVVSGPLIPMRYSRKASTVSSGSQLSNLSFAAWPAKTSNHAIFFLPAVGLLDCGIEHALTRCPNVRAGPIASDKRNNWIIGNVQSLRSGNLLARRRRNVFVRHKAEAPIRHS